MKRTIAPIFLLSLLAFAGCKSTPERTADAPSSSSQTAAETDAKPASDSNSDRGFDPCKLNPGLTICNKE
jgi:hypothetical protein